MLTVERRFIDVRLLKTQPMNKTTTMLWGMALCASTAMAQDITPVWLQHYNLPQNEILHSLIKQAPVGDNLANGTSGMVTYAGIARYDAERLIVGIRENGVDETAPGLPAAQLEIAEMYPDRSLIWINAETGEYIGIAHQFEMRPVVMEQEWVDAGGVLDFAFWTWAIDDGAPGEKALYSTYNNKLLRYAPNPAGGWVAEPTIAFEEPTPGSAAAVEATANGIPLSDAGPWQQWRPADLRISGSGADTEIFIGNKTWRNGQHNQLLHTEDGATFKPVARLNDREGARKGGAAGSGSASSPIRYGRDSERPNLVTTYEFHYPATGFGLPATRFNWDPDDPELEIESNREEFGGPWGTSHPWDESGNKPYRRYDDEMQVGFFNPSRAAAGDLPAWEWDQGPADHQGNQYDGFWGQILEGHSELDYVVSFSSPSWNTDSDSFRPGWVAVHSIDGSRTRNSEGQYSAVKLPFTGADQPQQAAPPRNDFIAVYGDVEIIPDAETPGKAEVLWVGRNYGFGVFTVESIPAAIVQQPAGLTVTQNQPFRIEAQFTGGVNLYQWYKDGEPIPGAARQHYEVELASMSDAGEYYLLAKNVLGDVETATVTVNVLADTEPPVPLSAGFLDGPFATVVGVQFDELLDVDTASIPANYVVAGNSVFSVLIRQDNKTAMVFLTNPMETSFQMQIVGVGDLAGNLTTAGTTVQVEVAPYDSIDVGTPTNFGGTSVATSANSLDVLADGVDIWGAADSFHYVYRQIEGDFDLAVRIDHASSNNNWARNSLMLRSSVLADSFHVSVGATPPSPDRGFYAHYRGELTPTGDPNEGFNTLWWNNATPEGPIVQAPLAFTHFPVWVRLVRSGNDFTAYRSLNGTSWTHFGDITVNMPQSALIGMATSSITYAKYSEIGVPTVIDEVGPVGIAMVGDEVILSWEGAGTLSTAPSIDGPWTPVAGAVSPYTVETSGAEAYYKLD
jgi:hypothetical protein